MLANGRIRQSLTALVELGISLGYGVLQQVVDVRPLLVAEATTKFKYKDS